LDSSLRQIIGEVNLNDLLTVDRVKIMNRIHEVVSRETVIFGVEIVDVRIMRGDLPQENSEAIFARMQTQREKEAREIRAKGAEEAEKIKAEADKQRTIILAQAKKNSDITKGKGEAEATKIYAEKTKMVVSPDGEFFKYFGNTR
jgi:membrane protease subunit HflC